MKLTKSIDVQTKEQESEMKLIKETTVEIEERETEMKLTKGQEPVIKLTKEVIVKIKDVEENDKLVLCISSYKGKIMPFHLHENLIRDLCKKCENYIKIC